MNELTSKQRAFLRKLAHSLKPVVHVGAEGVSPALIVSIVDALETRELLKVKVLQAAPAKARATADQISDHLNDVHVPQTIGRTIVLYRRHPENPEIKLPKAAGA